MIVCFATHKGGTGKTTSSINLAAGLARARKHTLLVDLDPQGHATIGIGVELGFDNANIADALSDRALPLASIIKPTDIPHLAIAPSNLRLATVAESLYAKVKREESLTRSMARLKPAYAWTVIDCPPALGVLTTNALAAAEVIIVPCPTGARALDGLEDLLDIVRLLKGDDFEDWWILITMFDPRKTVTQEIFAELLKPYESKVLRTKIFTSEALNQAQMAKQDVFTFDSRSRGARNYEALTRELLGHYR